MLIAAYIAIIALAVVFIGLGRAVAERRKMFLWMTPALRRTL